MSVLSNITDNLQTFLKAVVSPNTWTVQSVLVLGGIASIIAGIVYAWLGVSAANKAQNAVFSKFQLNSPPTLNETEAAADTKSKVVKAAYLVMFGLIALLLGFPVVAGVLFGSATNTFM